jgi:chitinase
MKLAGMAPEDIPLGYYTHINFAFALVNPTTFHVEDMAPSTAALYDRVSALKARDPDLEVWIGKFSIRFSIAARL